MKVRQPAAAGQFYPDDPVALEQMVSRFLNEAGTGEVVPRAIIAPHAGYRYSGPIAASAYGQVASAAASIERVFLVGPAHHVPLRGFAASSAEAFATPLGRVKVERALIEQLVALPQVRLFDRAHEQEHGLEVHLPFLQVILTDVPLVPLLLGEATPEAVAEVLQQVVEGGSTLIVVSSDLSHYQPYHRAVRLDQETSQHIEWLQRLAAGQACGRNAINGLLQLAQHAGWKARTLDVRNSGDMGGPRHQVVGYGAYIFN